MKEEKTSGIALIVLFFFGLFFYYITDDFSGTFITVFVTGIICEAVHVIRTGIQSLFEEKMPAEKQGKVSEQKVAPGEELAGRTSTGCSKPLAGYERWHQHFALDCQIYRQRIEKARLDYLEKNAPGENSIVDIESLINEGFLPRKYICPSGGSYSFFVDAKRNIFLRCSFHDCDCVEKFV